MKKEKTIFQKIIDREAPAEIIYEDEIVIVIYDAFPVEPGHFLVIPKKFSVNLIDIDEQTFLYCMSIARKIAKEKIKEWKVDGFRLIINNGKNAKQVVFHTHIHIVPAKKN